MPTNEKHPATHIASEAASPNLPGQRMESSRTSIDTAKRSASAPPNAETPSNLCALCGLCHEREKENGGDAGEMPTLEPCKDVEIDPATRYYSEDEVAYLRDRGLEFDEDGAGGGFWYLNNPCIIWSGRAKGVVFVDSEDDNV